MLYNILVHIMIISFINNIIVYCSAMNNTVNTPTAYIIYMQVVMIHIYIYIYNRTLYRNM